MTIKQCYFSSLNHFYSTANTVPNIVFYFHFLNLFTSYSTSDSSNQFSFIIIIFYRNTTHGKTN